MNVTKTLHVQFTMHVIKNANFFFNVNEGVLMLYDALNRNLLQVNTNLLIIAFLHTSASITNISFHLKAIHRVNSLRTLTSLTVSKGLFIWRWGDPR